MSKSKTDKARLDAIHGLPCICCVEMHVLQPSKTEAHHLVDKGNREASGGDQATIPLCGWHHRADVLRYYKYNTPKPVMLETYGPSMKYQGGKGKFELCFGTQRELLAKTNELLSMTTGEG